MVRVLREDSTLDPAFDPGLPDEEVVGLYRSMLRNRVLDDRLSALQRQGRIGFHVGSIGEEASSSAPRTRRGRKTGFSCVTGSLVRPFSAECRSSVTSTPASPMQMIRRKGARCPITTSRVAPTLPR